MHIDWLGQCVHDEMKDFYISGYKYAYKYDLDDIYLMLRDYNIKGSSFKLIDMIVSSLSCKRDDFRLNVSTLWRQCSEFISQQSEQDYLELLTTAVILTSININIYKANRNISYISLLYNWLVLESTPLSCMDSYDIRRPENLGKNIATGGKLFRESLVKYGSSNLIKELQTLYKVNAYEGYSSRVLESIYGGRVLGVLHYQLFARYNSMCGVLDKPRNETNLLLEQLVRLASYTYTEYVTIPKQLVKMLYRRKYILPAKGVLLHSSFMSLYDISDLFLLNYINTSGDFVIEVSYNKGNFIINLSRCVCTALTVDDFTVINFIISFFLKSEDIDMDIEIKHQRFGNGGFTKDLNLIEDILDIDDFSIIIPKNWLVEQNIKHKYVYPLDLNNEFVKEVLIQPFTRRLSSNQTASSKAVTNAKKYCLDIPDGYTLVDKHIRFIKLSEDTDIGIDIPRIG